MQITKSQLKQLIKEELDKIIVKKGNIIKIEGIPFQTNEDVEVLGKNENAKLVHRLKNEIKQITEEVIKEQKLLIKILKKIDNITKKFIEKQIGGHISAQDELIIKKNLDILRKNLQLESKQIEQIDLSEQFKPNWLNKLDNIILKLLLKYLPSSLPKDQVKKAVHLYVQDMQKIAT